MKTKLKDYGHVCWYVLTEVPGWPDAPFRARLIRAMPILLPLVIIATTAIWRAAVYSPEQYKLELQLQPLLSLEQQVSGLQVANSEQQVAQLAEQASTASKLLLDNPEAITPFLRELKARAKTAGWDASFQRAEKAEETATEAEQVTYVQVRGRLKPLQSNTDPYSSLVALLERLSTSEKRIDLTRLAIRADDTRWQAVELSLRLVCPAVHAKTP